MMGAFSSFAFQTTTTTPYEDDEENGQATATQSLLGNHSASNNALLDDNNYSMKGYFLMFVDDVYKMFRSLHIVLQVILVAFFGWVAWKLY